VPCIPRKGGAPAPDLLTPALTARHVSSGLTEVAIRPGRLQVPSRLTDDLHRARVVARMVQRITHLRGSRSFHLSSAPAMRSRGCVNESLPRLSVRQWLVGRQRTIVYRWRRMTFDAERLWPIVVCPGPDGRPGERVLAPSRAIYVSQRAGPCGSREDFRVVIGRGGSTFAVVCLGPTQERGDPMASAWQSLKRVGKERYGAYSAPVEEEVAGTTGCRYRIALGAKGLTEWKFAHDGWLFVGGVLAVPADHEATMITSGRASARGSGSKILSIRRNSSSL